MGEKPGRRPHLTGRFGRFLYRIWQQDTPGCHLCENRIGRHGVSNPGDDTERGGMGSSHLILQSSNARQGRSEREAILLLTAQQLSPISQLPLEPNDRYYKIQAINVPGHHK